ncbi:MAG: hypothetical protein R6V07_02355 [Armatimonadota bacterium]
MRFLSWLRKAVADFFNASDAREADAERVRQELEKLRSLTMLAVAQARRTELELRDSLAHEPENDTRLATLVPRLEEERARADNLMQRYRAREAEEEERLSRLGQIQLAEEINQRRRDLRGRVDFAERTSREEDLNALEDEARAEAFRLDVVEALDTDGEADLTTPQRGGVEDLRARARKLLEQTEVDRSEEA